MKKFPDWVWCGDHAHDDPNSTPLLFCEGMTDAEKLAWIADFLLTISDSSLHARMEDISKMTGRIAHAMERDQKCHG